MTEIEPTIDNVRVGDVVVIERGTPGEPGHTSNTCRVNENERRNDGEFRMWTLQRHLSEFGFRITRITRPDEPIPTEPGERFWAQWIWGEMEVAEFMVTDEQAIVNLSSGAQWERDMFERHHTAVPAPEPETVPVPADLIREAERWHSLPTQSGDVGVGILTRIVRAVRELEEADDD